MNEVFWWTDIFILQRGRH